MEHLPEKIWPSPAKPAGKKPNVCEKWFQVITGQTFVGEATIIKYNKQDYNLKQATIHWSLIKQAANMCNRA